MQPRSPPHKSRREAFVDRALQYAEDDSHGYSQRPPSGRWGPDYDCSSLLYQLADEAGYSVGTGSDKVRFTGTMLKDFEKAGFQILPFANVGISDLKVGDILLNLALHAEVYVGNGESVGATGSETGGFVGESGDQTGHEIEKHPVTTFDKEWDYILRPPIDEEENEEGDKEVPPMNYQQPMQTQPQGMMYQQPNTGGWPQAMPQRMNYSSPGYPQGNLGQMNGYSQASAGYPQAGMSMVPQGMGPEMDLCYVKGIEGANALTGIPNSRKAVFDDDKALMYIVSFGPQGNPVDIRVRPFGDEISEEFPQHLSPLMKQNTMPMGGMGQQQGEYITRAELEQMLKEMLPNAQSANASTEPNAAAHGASQSANAGRTR